MLTNEDKKWIKGTLSEHKGWTEDTFATKKEIKEVRDSVDLARQKLTTMSLEKYDFSHRFDSMEASVFRTEEKFDKIMTVLDGFTGKVADLEQENRMGAITFHRHGANIQELAEATGTKLSL